ncbi:hypothetical protein N431DRAFT_404073 [Stipitochalara longipes BDJ]|nr:hypothetical protein N431DRAFT_404073 [Stipitochalara longipes BDJ]
MIANSAIPDQVLTSVTKLELFAFCNDSIQHLLMAMSKTSFEESSVSSKDGSEARLLEDHHEIIFQPSRHRVRFMAVVTWFSIVLNIILSGVILLHDASDITSKAGRNAKLKAVSNYSPLLDLIDIPLSNVKMNATVLNADPPSIYRADPSPEVDEAWHRIANTNTIVLSTEDVEKLGFNSSRTARYPPELGFGLDAHIGRIDVFHQLHCLNEIRKDVNFDHYFGHKYGNRSNVPEIHKLHTSHCIYLLMQNIMCNANVDIYMSYWVDVQNIPFPDFSINHQCRSFDALLFWQEANSLDFDSFTNITKPGLRYERVMTQAYKAATKDDFQHIVTNVKHD